MLVVTSVEKIARIKCGSAGAVVERVIEALEEGRRHLGPFHLAVAVEPNPGLWVRVPEAATARRTEQRFLERFPAFVGAGTDASQAPEMVDSSWPEREGLGGPGERCRWYTLGSASPVYPFLPGGLSAAGVDLRELLSYRPRGAVPSVFLVAAWGPSAAAQRACVPSPWFGDWTGATDAAVRRTDSLGYTSLSFKVDADLITVCGRSLGVAGESTPDVGTWIQPILEPFEGTPVARRFVANTVEAVALARSARESVLRALVLSLEALCADALLGLGSVIGPGGLGALVQELNRVRKDGSRTWTRHATMPRVMRSAWVSAGGVSVVAYLAEERGDLRLGIFVGGRAFCFRLRQTRPRAPFVLGPRPWAKRFDDLLAAIEDHVVSLGHASWQAAGLACAGDDDVSAAWDPPPWSRSLVE